MKLKRFVTTRDTTGAAIFCDQLERPASIEFQHVPGFSVTPLWATDHNPSLTSVLPEAAPSAQSMVPAPGETRCVIVEFPPDETMQKINDWEAVGEEYAVKLPGLAELFEPDAPGMHTTPTVDYIVVLSGELSLEVDNGVRRDLKVGDVIIQNGTRHAWRNTSNAPARILSVMIGAVS